MNFYSKFIDRLHVIVKPLYGLLHDNNKFHWNNELETLFQQIKTKITKDVTLTLHNTIHPKLTTKDSPVIAIGCVSFQTIDKGKLDILSYIF